MLFAFISTILSAFSDVFWKKSLNHKVGPRAHELACYPIGILLLIYFIYSWFSLSDVWLSAFIVCAIIISIDSIRQPVMQQVYKEEKLSVIMPYLNLSKIFIIIASFFIFKDVSNTAFFITLITIVVIIIWSIDFKTLKLPRNFTKILFVETLRASAWLLWWWLVVNHTEMTFFNLYVIFWGLFMLTLTLKTWQYKDLAQAPLIFWKQREIAALWWVSWFLSLVVIKNLGLSLSILLGFLWIWITLLFSYLFLKDVPSKKNILLTVIVSVLIWIWYYFK